MAFVKGTSGNDIIDLADGVTNGSDTISGYGGNDTLKGAGGNDTLFGDDGKDKMYGGDGDDHLWGGPGADRLDGGAGLDEAHYYDSPEAVTISLMSGLGSGGTAEDDELISIERVSGSAFDDTLWGDNADNYLMGLAGGDLVKGFGGNDRLWGGDGNDTLFGGDGDDNITGGGGDNYIHAGPGRDHIWDTGGANTLVWSSISEAPLAPDPSWPIGVNPNDLDTIRDFDHAEGDVIDLSAIDADPNAPGDQAFTFIGSATFSGTPGELNYYEWCGIIIIQMQTGTSPDAEAMLYMDWFDSASQLHIPEANWFVL
jgi:Ca2+-binding RTX toxin-like protein